MYCEKCGKEIPDDSKFCEFCGTPVKVVEKAKGTEPVLPKKEVVNKKPKDIQTVKKVKKPKSKFLFVILFIALIAIGGYFALSFLGMEDLLTKIPNLILGKNDSMAEPTRSDFSWYVPMSYDEIPQDGIELMLEDIQGEWKVMAINYLSTPEETYFSTVELSENASSEFNITVDFTHYYVEYDGEKYPFEEEDAKERLYANFNNSYLTLALGDDKIAEIIFWSANGQEYGQSHIYSDWDNDGFDDLTTVVLFTR